MVEGHHLHQQETGMRLDLVLVIFALFRRSSQAEWCHEEDQVLPCALKQVDSVGLRLLWLLVGV